MSLPELQQNPLVQRVIDIFDTDGNGEVDFKGKLLQPLFHSTSPEAHSPLRDEYCFESVFGISALILSHLAIDHTKLRTSLK